MNDNTPFYIVLIVLVVAAIGVAILFLETPSEDLAGQVWKAPANYDSVTVEDLVIDEYTYKGVADRMQKDYKDRRLMEGLYVKR